MKSISNILSIVAASVLFSLVLGSCGKGKGLKPGTKEQEFKTTCRIELSDGRVFESEEIHKGGNNLYQRNPKVLALKARGFEGNKKNFITATLYLDENSNLRPFGAKNDAGDYQNLIVFSIESPKESFMSMPNPAGSQSVIGNHSLSHLVIHSHPRLDLGMDYPTCRYEFSGVVLYGLAADYTEIEVTASGHILCELM